MENCNKAKNLASTTHLGIDKEGERFQEDWNYASVVGMVMYLGNNSRPEIAFSVNQCARFTHCPKESHEIGIKHILRYFHEIRTKGMYIKPSQNLQVDCYVDADFTGLWGVEHYQDPTYIKSRTGYLVEFTSCPLVWVSKLQTQIALSTMESE